VSGGQSTLAVVVQDGHSHMHAVAARLDSCRIKSAMRGWRSCCTSCGLRLLKEALSLGSQRPGGQKADPRRGHGELPAEFGIAVAGARQHKQPPEGLLGGTGAWGARNRSVVMLRLRIRGSGRRGHRGGGSVWRLAVPQWLGALTTRAPTGRGCGGDDGGCMPDVAVEDAKEVTAAGDQEMV
jgi:hypothetical protein